MQGFELREFLDKPSEQSSSASSDLEKQTVGLRAQDVSNPIHLQKNYTMLTSG